MKRWMLTKLAELEINTILLDKGLTDLAEMTTQLSEATAELANAVAELSTLCAEMAEKYGERIVALEGKKHESV